MNEQNFGEKTNTPDFTDEHDQDMHDSVQSINPFVPGVPVLAALVEQTPVNEAVVVPGAPSDHAFRENLHEDTNNYQAPIAETNKAPADELVNTHAPVSPNAAALTSLLSHDESEYFRVRWNEIQGNFVDEPRAAVQQADTLVSEIVEKITKLFANEHGKLEGQWKQGNEVSTEDLRMALQHYRSFFNRLVV